MDFRRIIAEILRACAELPERERVELYNACTMELREMMRGIADDPVLAIQLVPAGNVRANDYNPNRVASPEMDLLEDSIRADGVTMPVVVMREPGSDIHLTVDGFHRQLVLTSRMARRYIPCSLIDADVSNRMASTIRHNRARGKHQVDLMGEIVKALMGDGWDDERIALHLGMSLEELLRLKQIVGAARLLAAEQYSASYGRDDEPENIPDK